jgi:hypothetical protein
MRKMPFAWATGLGQSRRTVDLPGLSEGIEMLLRASGVLARIDVI